MWQSYQRLTSIWLTEGDINDSILDLITQDPKSRPSTVSLVAFGNYLKFMLCSQKDGVLQQPTEEKFRKWYNGSSINVQRRLLPNKDNTDNYIRLDPPYPVVIKLQDNDVFKVEKFSERLLKTHFEDAQGKQLIDKYKITNTNGCDHVDGYFIIHTWSEDYKITRVSDNKVVATITQSMPQVTTCFTPAPWP